MATATATHVRPPPTTANANRHTYAAPPPPHLARSSSHGSVYAAEVERDEAWVHQLQEEQRQRFTQEAGLMHKDHLAELANEGPFATPETREALHARYEERLEKMRAMQLEELDQLIERERQERLWSLGLEDEGWDGWNMVIQDQAAILANIRRAAAMGTDAGVQERIRENAREAEDVGRRSDEWQRTEPQRMVDRARWAQRQRLTSAHVGERRKRDLAEAESQAAQARAREAQLHETLGTSFESASSSRPDSLFSTAGSSIDTPPSSMYGERWRPSPGISIPAPADEAHRDRPSPADDLRRASPARPSPLSGTPTSFTMKYAKVDESARPTVWIPPESARSPVRKDSRLFDSDEPARKSSGVFDGHEATRKPSGPFDSREPARKSSGLFDTSEPARKPSMQFGPGAQEDPTRKAYQAAPSPQPQPQPQQPPNAPSLRSAPLPTPQPSYTPPPQQPQPPPQPQSYSRPTAQARPAASPPVTSASQPRRQETNTPPKTAYPSTAANTRPAPSPTGTRPAPQTARSAPTPSPPAPAPPGYDPAEERRKQLREQYTKSEAQRVEGERRRREEEANEKRADEARRRGAEKRRAEEEAREAERKEAERRARAAGIKAGPVKMADIAEVWAAYESQWAAMASATQLRFRSIPWPVPVPVFEPAGLLPIQIAAFVLSPAHSQGKGRKDRLKEALLRWHPDRFEAKWLRKVVEEEREVVKEGVGLVVRALNDLFSADGTFAA